MSKYRSVINTVVGLAIIVLVVWSWLQLEWYTWLLLGVLLASGLGALENLVNRKLWKV